MAAVVVDICVHTAAVVCRTALCRTFHGSLAVTVIVWEEEEEDTMATDHSAGAVLNQ